MQSPSTSSAATHDAEEELFAAKVTPIEVLARQRERCGYAVLQELKDVIHATMRITPPSTGKITLGVDTAHIHHSAAAVKFLCVQGFELVDENVLETCDGTEITRWSTRPTLQLPLVPAPGTKEHDVFVKDWVRALGLIRWAGECNSMQLDIRGRRLNLMRGVLSGGGEYRVAFHVSWTDEIGNEKRETIYSPYYDAASGVILSSQQLCAAGGGGAAARDKHAWLRCTTPTVPSSGSEDDDSFDGSEDGLYPTSNSSDSGTPQRQRQAKCSALRTATESNIALGGIVDADGGANKENEACEGGQVAERGDEGGSFALRRLAELVKNKVAGGGHSSGADSGAARGPPPSPPVIHSSPPEDHAMLSYRFGMVNDLRSTCDKACDVRVEVLKKRPIIADKVVAFGRLHYLNYGCRTVDLELRDPDRPVGLPIGWITVQISSLAHRCFAVEQRERALEARNQLKPSLPILGELQDVGSSPHPRPTPHQESAVNNREEDVVAVEDSCSSTGSFIAKGTVSLRRPSSSRTSSNEELYDADDYY